MPALKVLVFRGGPKRLRPACQPAHSAGATARLGFSQRVSARLTGSQAGRPRSDRVRTGTEAGEQGDKERRIRALGRASGTALLRILAGGVHRIRSSPWIADGKVSLQHRFVNNQCPASLSKHAAGAVVCMSHVFLPTHLLYCVFHVSRVRARLSAQMLAEKLSAGPSHIRAWTLGQGVAQIDSMKWRVLSSILRPMTRAIRRKQCQDSLQTSSAREIREDSESLLRTQRKAEVA